MRLAIRCRTLQEPSFPDHGSRKEDLRAEHLVRGLGLADRLTQLFEQH